MEGSYPSAEKQSVYSTAPFDWTSLRFCLLYTKLESVRKATSWRYSFLQKFGNDMLYYLHSRRTRQFDDFMFVFFLYQFEDYAEYLNKVGCVHLWSRTYRISEASPIVLIIKNSWICRWNSGHNWQWSRPVNPSNISPGTWEGLTFLVNEDIWYFSYKMWKG